LLEEANRVNQSREKIDAIYTLRDAVETKTKLEAVVDENPSPDARAALLDATLDVEAKTQHAIEVCHECGHTHANDSTCTGSNVVNVQFRPPNEADDAI
jgi:ABC-type nickel/cobalt efflux system permease component RcnA